MVRGLIVAARQDIFFVTCRGDPPIDPRLAQHQVIGLNTIRAKHPPEGDFAEVTRQDEERFLDLAKNRKSITYAVPKMGTVPHDVYMELLRNGYVEYVVEGSDQRYLVAE